MTIYLRFDPEFQKLIPPLADDELAALKASIQLEGIREALIVWDGIVVDGHNRLLIAREIGLPESRIPVDFRNFADRSEAMVWMIDNQRGRRNLSKEALLELGFKRAELLKPKAEENLREGGRIGGEGGKPCRNSDKALPPIEPVDILKEAATYAGVNRDTASKFKKVMDSDNDEIKEKVRTGETSINRAYQEEKRKKDSVKKEVAHVANNSGENEWYTPVEYIDAARRVLRGIDCDPASSKQANETVNAETYYTKEDDGLTKEWHGRVWMNPPYSQPLISQFAEAIASKYQSGEIEEAIVLVNNATETVWFQTMATHCSAICFPRGRIRFIDKNGKPSGAPLQGQAVLYMGNNRYRFEEKFKEFGMVLWNEV